MGTDINGVFQKRTENGWEDVESNYSQDRDYPLFARLGNVRNGYGFNGYSPHHKVLPLSDNRGYPEGFDVDEENMHPISCNSIRGTNAEWYKDEDSDPTNKDYLRLWMGDHSHSWLSDSEIINAQSLCKFDDTGSFAKFVEEVRRLKELHGEVRFVFGFDG